MVQVAVIGTGQTPPREHWDKDPRELTLEALLTALQNAHIKEVDTLYVGNMLGGELKQQENLAALITEALSRRGIRAIRVVACSSGAAALLAGYLAIASGQSDRVAVVGVEKTTDLAPRAVMQALAFSDHRDEQAARGFSFDSLNALWIQRYMHEFDLMEEDFAYFSLNLHAIGQYNPCAMFRRSVTLETYLRARAMADPIYPFDAGTTCDGAAAIILSRGDRLNRNQARTVTVTARTPATDQPSLSRRPVSH